MKVKHMKGFHEARLDIDYIKEQTEDIEELVKLAKKLVPDRLRNQATAIDKIYALIL